MLTIGLKNFFFFFLISPIEQFEFISFVINNNFYWDSFFPLNYLNILISICILICLMLLSTYLFSQYICFNLTEMLKPLFNITQDLCVSNLPSIWQNKSIRKENENEINWIFLLLTIFFCNLLGMLPFFFTITSILCFTLFFALYHFLYNNSCLWTIINNNLFLFFFINCSKLKKKCPKRKLMFFFFIKIIFILITIAFFTILERKVMAAIQRRKGPNVVGLFGLGQPLADGLKLLYNNLFTIKKQKWTSFVTLLPIKITRSQRSQNNSYPIILNIPILSIIQIITRLLKYLEENPEIGFDIGIYLIVTLYIFYITEKILYFANIFNWYGTDLLKNIRNHKILYFFHHLNLMICVGSVMFASKTELLKELLNLNWLTIFWEGVTLVVALYILVLCFFYIFLLLLEMERGFNGKNRFGNTRTKILIYSFIPLLITGVLLIAYI